DAQGRVLVDVEVGVHRVDRHDGREQGAAVLVPRLHQVAHGDDVAADAPADRREDLRVVEVQLAGRDQGPVGRDVGQIDVPGRAGLIQVRLRRGPAVVRGQVPLVLRLVELQLRLVLADLRLRLVQQGLVRPRVDLEEDVSLLDQVPFPEVDLLQVAPHVGPHVDGIDRGRPAGEIRVVRRVPLERAADRDGGGRCRRRSRGCPGAAGQADTEPKNESSHRSTPCRVPRNLHIHTLRPPGNTGTDATPDTDPRDCLPPTTSIPFRVRPEFTAHDRMGISRYSRRPPAPYPAVASAPNGATKAVRTMNVRLVRSVLAAIGTETRRISEAYRHRGTSALSFGLVGEQGAQTARRSTAAIATLSATTA